MRVLRTCLDPSNHYRYIATITKKQFNQSFAKKHVCVNVRTYSCYMAVCACLPPSRECKPPRRKGNATSIFINLVKPIMGPETAHK